VLRLIIGIWKQGNPNTLKKMYYVRRAFNVFLIKITVTRL